MFTVSVVFGHPWMFAILSHFMLMHCLSLQCAVCPLLGPFLCLAEHKKNTIISSPSMQ